MSKNTADFEIGAAASSQGLALSPGPEPDPVSTQKTLSIAASLSQSSMSSVVSNISYKSDGDSGCSESSTKQRLRNENSSLVSKLNSLRAVSKQDKRLIVQLQQQNQTQLAELQQRTTTITEIQANVQKISGLCALQNSRIQDLQLQLKSVQSDKLQLQRDLEQKLSGTNADYQVRLQQIQSDSCASIAALEMQIEKVNQEKEEMQSKLKDTTHSYAEIQEAHAETKQSLRQLHNQLDDIRLNAGKNTTLMLQQQRGLQEDFDVARQQWATQKAQLQQETMSALESIQKLQDQLQHAQLNANQSRIESEEAHQKAAAFKLHADMVPTLQQQLRQKDAQIRTLHEQAQQSLGEASCTKSDLEMVQHEVEQLKQTLYQSQQELRSKSEQCCSLEDTIAKQQQDRLNTSQEQSTQNAQLQEQLQRANTRIEELEASLDERVVQIESHSQQLDRLRGYHAEQEVALDKSKRTIADLQRQIETQTQTDASLRQQLEFAHADMKANRDDSQMVVDELDNLRNLSSEARSVGARLVSAYEAVENSFTCSACMQLFSDPVTLVPCGHCVCRKCVYESKDSESGSLHCPDCLPGKEHVHACIANPLLDDLYGRLQFFGATLAKLRELQSQSHDVI
jgi:chromosome segregation ATPase